MNRRSSAVLAGTFALLASLPAAPQGSSPLPGRAPVVVTSLTLFAGTSSGLWRSENWGGSWSRIRPGAVHAILPLGPRVLVGGASGLAISDDFGQAWQDVPLESPLLSVLPSRYPLSDPTVFAGTAVGLLRSQDGGRTFGSTPLSGAPVRRLEWPGPDLVVAAGNTVMVSADGARTFRPAGSGLGGSDVLSLAVSSFYAADPVLFAGLAGGGVFRSADGGRTWKAAGLVGQTVNDLVWLGPFLYAATGDGLFRSEDVGAHWTPLPDGLAGRSAERLMFPLAPDSGAEAFLGTDRGVYHTMDGGLHWTASGLKDEAVLALATFPPPERTPGKRRKR